MYKKRKENETRVMIIRKIVLLTIFSMFFSCNIIFANDLKTTLESVNVVTLYGRKTMVDEMDTIKFGRYPQDSESTNDLKEIEWLVLENDEENHKVLLLSKYILDCKCFNDKYERVTWKTCTLRKWLNDSFYKEAFDEEEREKIVLTELMSGLDNDVMSKDRVFLLGFKDLKKYFRQYSLSTDNPKLATKATNYAMSIDNNGEKLWVRTNSKWNRGNSYFFLRECGVDESSVSAVGSGGNVYGGLYDPSRIVSVNVKDGGIRPAIWVLYQ